MEGVSQERNVDKSRLVNPGKREGGLPGKYELSALVGRKGIMLPIRSREEKDRRAGKRTRDLSLGEKRSGKKKRFGKFWVRG